MVAAAHTKWNIVYDISARKIYFRSVAGPTLKYLSLKDFDFSCSNPMLMLDVNASIKGDVSEEFISYDHDINLSTFMTVLNRVKIKVPRKDIEALMRHFESFQCTE